MRIRIYIAIVFFLNGCSSSLENEFNDFVITPTYSAKNGVEYVALTCEFKFNRDVNFIFDHDALSLDSYNTEDEKTVRSLDDLLSALASIEHPQFIVENQKGKKRLFSEVIFFDGEKFNPKDVFKLERTLDTLRIIKDQSVKVKSIFIDVNRLKINKGDSVIRLYYMYKPTEEEKKMNFYPILLKSNWINLYNIKK